MNKKIIIIISLILAFLTIPGIAQEGTIDKIILASELNYPDAIVSAAVSQKLGIPILLTKKTELPESLISTLQDIKPKEIIVVGGPAVISDNVVNQLKKDYNITRLWGMTRYGTATKITSHFWPEGAPEAVLVEDELKNKKGNILGMAKNLAGQRPIFPIPSGKIPSQVLTELQELNIEKVTLIARNITPEMKSDLASLGIEIKKTIQQNRKEDLERDVKQEIEKEIIPNQTLVIVATSDFKNIISAPDLPHAKSLLISTNEEIEDAINIIKEKNITKVKIVGNPVLAQKIFERLENQTEADVDLIVKQAAEAVQQAAKIARRYKQKFLKKFQKQKIKWLREVQKHKGAIKQRANKTIEKIKTLMEDYNATELQEKLQDGKNKFSKGKYKEALEKTREIKHKLREERWDNIKTNISAIHEEVQDDINDIREETHELAEVNREFGEEMRENMTVEERLETIQEFHERRKEKVTEIVEKAVEIRKERVKTRAEKVKEWIKQAKEKIKEKAEKEEPEEEIEIEAELQKGKANIKWEINKTEREFTLNTTNKEEITQEIISRTSLTRKQVIRNIEYEETEEEEKESEKEFCGTSTHGPCNKDNDCVTDGCSAQVCRSKNESSIITTCEFKDCYNAEKYNMKCICINNTCQWNKRTSTGNITTLAKPGQRKQGK